MEHLRIGEVAKALGVSVDTLRRWEQAGRIEFERVGNQRVLPADRLPELARALASPATTRTSARNHLPGVVVAIKKDTVMAQVELACGDFRVVSLISREALDELGLQVGSPATAVVKATNVMIDA